MIYQIHPVHGYHISYNSQEALFNEKHGWKTVTEKEFYDRPELKAKLKATTREKLTLKVNKPNDHG